MNPTKVSIDFDRDNFRMLEVDFNLVSGQTSQTYDFCVQICQL